jgi:hypothetical protein
MEKREFVGFDKIRKNMKLKREEISKRKTEIINKRKLKLSELSQLEKLKKIELLCERYKNTKCPLCGSRAYGNRCSSELECAKCYFVFGMEIYLEGIVDIVDGNELFNETNIEFVNIDEFAT